jgi:hypothetical protein
MGYSRGLYRAWWTDLIERDNLKELALDGRTIFKWIFKKWDEDT